jgi:hypothetical protein
VSHTGWLERVPDLVGHCREEWGLRLGELHLAGAAGYTVRADLPDGTAAVLKLVYPHREAEHEADALADWDGNGAVRLLARDDGRWAMLIERCEPGTRLSEIEPDAALAVMASISLGCIGLAYRPIAARSLGAPVVGCTRRTAGAPALWTPAQLFAQPEQVDKAKVLNNLPVPERPRTETGRFDPATSGWLAHE